MSRYVIGVDGGASKTRCLVAAVDGAIIGDGYSGCANKNVTSWEDAVLQVRLGVTEALVRGHVLPNQIVSAYYGLGGVVDDEDTKKWKEAVESLSPEAVVLVENDVFSALYAVDCSTGIGVVSGSGGNIGAIADGRSFHVNGHVHFSSAQLGRMALEVVMNQIKRGKCDLFGKAVLKWAGLDEVQLWNEVYVDHGGLAARISPIVIQLSNRGHLQAQSIILDWLTKVEWDVRQFQTANELESLPICFGGATFSSMRPIILEHLKASSKILVASVPLVEGAVRAARRQLGP